MNVLNKIRSKANKSQHINTNISNNANEKSKNKDQRRCQQQIQNVVLIDQINNKRHESNINQNDNINIKQKLNTKGKNINKILSKVKQSRQDEKQDKKVVEQSMQQHHHFKNNIQQRSQKQFQPETNYQINRYNNKISTMPNLQHSQNFTIKNVHNFQLQLQPTSQPIPINNFKSKSKQKLKQKPKSKSKQKSKITVNKQKHIQQLSMQKRLSQLSDDLPSNCSNNSKNVKLLIEMSKNFKWSNPQYQEYSYQQKQKKNQKFKLKEKQRERQGQQQKQKHVPKQYKYKLHVKKSYQIGKMAIFQGHLETKSIHSHSDPQLSSKSTPTEDQKFITRTHDPNIIKISCKLDSLCAQPSFSSHPHPPPEPQTLLQPQSVSVLYLNKIVCIGHQNQYVTNREGIVHIGIKNGNRRGL